MCCAQSSDRLGPRGLGSGQLGLGAPGASVFVSFQSLPVEEQWA